MLSSTYLLQRQADAIWNVAREIRSGYEEFLSDLRRLHPRPHGGDHHAESCFVASVVPMSRQYFQFVMMIGEFWPLIDGVARAAATQES